MDESLELVLADDHTVFLDGLTAILSQLGHRVLAAVNTHDALLGSVRAFRPQVCVTEMHLNGSAGTDAVAGVATAWPDTRVVVLTADPHPDTMHRALASGAAGYVHKTRGISVLVDVLARVVAGEIVIEGSFLRAEPAVGAPPHLLRLAAYLTAREQECLALLAAGRDTPAMAAELGVSATTVRTHVQAVLTKLGVHSRLEAAALATRFHLVPDSVATGRELSLLDAPPTPSYERTRQRAVRAGGHSASSRPRSLYASEARAARR